MKKHYDYDYDFLETWRKAHAIEKGELMTVINAKSRNNLDEWLGVSKAQREAAQNGQPPERKMLKLQHILAICNHYGIDLANFFTENGKPYKQKNEHVRNDTQHENEILKLKVKYYEELEKIRAEEKTLREKYDEQLKKMQEKIDLLQAMLARQPLATSLQDKTEKQPKTQKGAVGTIYL